MRSLAKIAVQAGAVSLILLGAALFAAPGCSIISAEGDCQTACEQLVTCNLLHEGNCTVYCAGLASGATIAGCADKFDAQNECGKVNKDCTAAAASCTQPVQDFAACMMAHCADHPNDQGCPGAGNGDGGTTGDGG
jgi:hypothetical protein